MTNLEGNISKIQIEALQKFIDGVIRLNIFIIARCNLHRRAQAKCLYVTWPLYLQCYDEPSSEL